MPWAADPTRRRFFGKQRTPLDVAPRQVVWTASFEAAMLDGMDDPPIHDQASGDAPGTRRRLPPWWTLIGLLCLYPLSMGPALVVAYWCDGYRLFGAGTQAFDAVQVIYWPIIALCERSPALTEMYDRYLQIWLGFIE